MAPETTLPALCERLLAAPAHGRRIVALAGAPGSGKSTLADALVERLNAGRPGVAAILPMDGYHYDDAVLIERGERARKGAPHTFDRDGFQHMLERLRRDDGRDVAVPVFDRALEIARAGARIIPATARIIVTEGNYLLLDAPGWRDLRPLFDVAILITASEDTLHRRLTERWQQLGFDADALAHKLQGNDLPNMRLVMAGSSGADFTIRTD